jgi:hypothetical protein
VTSGCAVPAAMGAVVCAADGVRFVAVGDHLADLIGQLADYVRARCDDALWPSAAQQVRTLMDDGLPCAAIHLYFSRVGDRWDREYLTLHPAGADADRILDPERSDALV